VSGNTVGVRIRDCQGGSVTYTNVHYQDGHTASFDFEIEGCGQRHTGRVYDIQYLNGTFNSASVEVDGRSCG